MAVLAGDVVRSGGGTAAGIQSQVQGWFFGADLPQAAANTTYVPVATSLYGTAAAPSLADMHQGALGDCYFIASLGAIADANPQAIESMITDNGDGTYTVRFYYQDAAGQYAPDYVTVNNELPVQGGNTLYYNGVGSDGAYWLALVEKAYAQWDASGNEGRGGVDSYADLTAGWMQNVYQQVLGQAAATFNTASIGEQAVIDDLAAGDPVTVACFTNDTTLQTVADHAYEIAGYNSSSDTFQLENPWGSYEPGSLTWAELCQYCPELVTT